MASSWTSVSSQFPKTGMESPNRYALLLLTTGFLTSCQTADVRPSIDKWTETLGGSRFTYGYTFDDRDYELISDLAESFHTRPRVFWQAPPGPDGSSSVTYLRDQDFDFLHKEMPSLRRDTFDSFVHRNSPIPAHRLLRWQSQQGKTVTVDIRASDPVKVMHLSRAGFSRDGNQALIYQGGGAGGIYLFERRGDTWYFSKMTVLWLS